MSSISRRGVLGTLGVASLAAAADAAGIPAFTGTSASAFASASATEPVFTFASLPDFFNGDVADLSAPGAVPTWDGGPNSVNESWMIAIRQCLGAVAAHGPEAVFLAGDMVEGHWNVDNEDRRLFGGVSQGIDTESITMCERAISTAGDAYYSFAASQFAQLGLPLYPSIGDHEILDDRSGRLNDRWSPSGFHLGVPDNRYYLVDHCKSVWAGHFTSVDGAPRFARRPRGSQSEGTAYAVSFADSLTLITVDTFLRHSSGVRLGVFGSQLTWLRDEIRRAKRRGHVVVVQGHIPIMTPARWMASGRLRVPEGRASAFYQVLDREGVDLYLCGEVHDTTAIRHGRHAPVQISHGCIFQYWFSFLVGRLYADGRLVLDSYEIPLLEASRDRSLWTSDTKKWQRTHLQYGDPRHTGRLVYRRGDVLKRTAKLEPYHPDNDSYGLRGRLGTVVV